MYSLYHITNLNNGNRRYAYKARISLAGCNNGIIANGLQEILKSSDTSEIGWSIPIAEKWNLNKLSVIIDIKPNSNEVFLCELDRVFGYSYREWSPIMLRLNILFNDIATNKMDKKNFIYPNEKSSVIYTMLYLAGSIKNGQLIGTWNFPGPSPTNSLLLWPEAMTYFFQQVKTYNPEFIKSDIKLISSCKEKHERTTNPHTA